MVRPYRERRASLAHERSGGRACAGHGSGDDGVVRWQPYFGSVAIHALLIGVALRANAPQESEPTPEQPAVELIDVSMESPPAAIDDDNDGGGGGHTAMALPEESRSKLRANDRGELVEAGVLTGIDTGTGIGNGIGNGNGDGIGDGTGRGNGLGARLDPGAALHALPAPPAPPVSKARPAKLIHPTREMEIDEAELFAAKVTVDETGDVVGARMTRSHPGSRGDTASSMIWQFRYSPALDDDGIPVKSTFVQTFAVR